MKNNTDASAICYIDFESENTESIESTYVYCTSDVRLKESFFLLSVADPWHFGVDPDPDPDLYL
jgi:hypothetical protein